MLHSWQTDPELPQADSFASCRSSAIVLLCRPSAERGFPQSELHTGWHWLQSHYSAACSCQGHCWSWCSRCHAGTPTTLKTFLQGHIFFVFWSPSDCNNWPILTNKSSNYTLCQFMVHVNWCNYSKHGKQKNPGPRFACCRRQSRTPVAIAGHHCGLAGQTDSDITFLKNAFSSFRLCLIFVFNDFKGLQNTLRFKFWAFNSAWKRFWTT